ncbi:MAG: hypothetical protein HKO97_14015, partial [Flavobacteriaceae bacterium]|nr:hypothetical protein [Flavobacteriaceae bacterium]
TYVLPCTIPMALLLVHWWKDDLGVVRVAAAFPILSFLAFVVLIATNQWRGSMKSDAYMIKSLNIDHSSMQYPYYYWKNISFSGTFYSEGNVELIYLKPKEVKALLEIDQPVYLFVKNKETKEIPDRILKHFTLVDSNNWRSVYVTTPEKD